MVYRYRCIARQLRFVFFESASSSADHSVQLFNIDEMVKLIFECLDSCVIQDLQSLVSDYSSLHCLYD